MKKKSVILLSGGLDSATTLAIAASEGAELYAVSFAYGQRHSIELESARRIASLHNVRKHLILKFDLREIGGSALTSEIEVPKRHSQAAFDSSGIPVTYVPARNTVFLSFALSWAEVLQAADIFIGANSVDYSGYPDCRPQYLKAFEEMANLATKISSEGKLRFRIRAPLIAMSKSEIIQTGTKLGVDYSLTWSCYDPVGVQHSHPAPCGKCDSCILREKGFAAAGIQDPLLHLYDQ